MSDHPDQREPGDDTLPPSLAAAIAAQGSLAPSQPATVERVMREVRRSARRRRTRRLVLGTAGMAAMLLLLVIPYSAGDGLLEPEAGTLLVEFALENADARGLSLVGDFNAWDVRATPMVRVAATGRWVASVPLREGRYLYAFVADGSRWLPDPRAPLAAADDFARLNSVLVVGGAAKQ